MISNYVRWRGVLVNKVGTERPRVAELVVTGGNGQRHGEVVAFCKAEEDVLHSGAGGFMSLQEGYTGVFSRRSTAALGGRDCGGWTAQPECLQRPAIRKRESVQKSTQYSKL